MNNITNNLLFLQNRELGHPVSKSGFLETKIINNLKSNQYSKFKYKGHQSGIIKLVVEGVFAATITAATLRLWNLERRSFIWSKRHDFDVGHDSHRISNLFLKIVLGKIVLAGKTLDSHMASECGIKIYDLKTGNPECSISYQQLDGLSNFSVVDQRIYADLSNNYIGIWDLSGKLVETVPFGTIDRNKPTLCFQNDKFIVYMQKNEINIFNVAKKENTTLSLKDLQLEEVEFSEGFIQNSMLYCGMSKDSKFNFSDFCIVDLDKMCLNNQFSLKHLGSGRRESVNKIIVNENWIYLGYCNGDVYAFNLIEFKQYLVGKNNCCIDFMALHGPMLMTGCNDKDKEDLKIWNIKKLESNALNQISNLIANIDVPNYSNLLYEKGKIQYVSGNKLVQLDFLLPKQLKLTDTKKIEVQDVDEEDTKIEREGLESQMEDIMMTENEVSDEEDYSDPTLEHVRRMFQSNTCNVQ